MGDYDDKVYGEIQLHGWNHGEVPALLFLDRNISHLAIRVFAYLQWRGAKSGQCWPGLETVARELGTSERSIKGTFQELTEADWIRRQRRLGTSSVTHIFESQEDCRQWGNILPEQMGNLREVGTN